MQIKVYNVSGKQIKKVDTFEAKKQPSESLLYLLNRIAVVSRIMPGHTKTRAERRGGGVKPWRQKGTGRARVGSSRTPIWRKGGIVFGPRKNKNFKLKFNRQSMKTTKIALLNQKIKENSAFIWQISDKDLPKKTKEAEAALLKLPIKEGLMLLLVGEKQEFKSLKNISYLSIKRVNNLTLRDLLRYQTIIVTIDAAKNIAKK